MRRALVVAGALVVAVVSMTWFARSYAGHGPVTPRNDSYGIARSGNTLLVFECRNGIGSVEVEQGDSDNSTETWRADRQPGTPAKSSLSIGQSNPGYATKGTADPQSSESLTIVELSDASGVDSLVAVLRTDARDLEDGEAAARVGKQEINQIELKYPSCQINP